MSQEKFYPDSKVELQGFTAKFYDHILNFATLNIYSRFIKKAIAAIQINPEDRILDFGAGTGRNALLMSKYLSSKGKILGLEISDIMIYQFKKNTKNDDRLQIEKKRIDQPLDLNEKFDKVFISFVFHGFPLEIQNIIIENAHNSLRPGGEFIILDFGEFVTKETPFWFRIPFKIIECKYAFEYVERDWKKILAGKGFIFENENLFLKEHLRVLKVKKKTDKT